MCITGHKEATMRVRTMADLGAALQDARERRGLTQVDLARRAGVSREWLVKVEAGRTPAEMTRVLAVVAELGLVLDLQRPEG
jgi:y4mF family transcriptional regulator